MVTQESIQKPVPSALIGLTHVLLAENGYLACNKKDERTKQHRDFPSSIHNNIGRLSRTPNLLDEAVKDPSLAT